MRRFACLLTIVALPAAFLGSGGAVAEGNVTDSEPPANYAGLPPQGAHASMPATAKLLVSVSPSPWSTWNVYADGRIVWQKWNHSGDALVLPRGASMLDTGYVEQRLTPRGVQLFRSRVLSTGLFQHNLRLVLGNHARVYDRVRRGDRMVSVEGVPSPSQSWKNFTKPTPAQARGLAQLDALLADPASWLPKTAWANREIRAFVPSHYLVALDRGPPDMSKLPAPLPELLRRYKKLLRHGCQVVATSQARAILQAFVETGISPSDNHAYSIAFDFKGLGFYSPVVPPLPPSPPERPLLNSTSAVFACVSEVVGGAAAPCPGIGGKPPPCRSRYERA
jgi:hypothetical protein